jgi:hypothetical protein
MKTTMEMPFGYAVDIPLGFVVRSKFTNISFTRDLCSP